MDHVMSGIGIS